MFAVAAIWNMWRLSSPSMWQDEIATVENTRYGLSGVLSVVQDRDAVMAAYYVAIDAWTAVFGTSDASFRFPSVLAMAVAASASFLLSRKYVGTLGSSVVAVLVTAAPSMTRYAQEARVYAVVVACVVVATLLLHEAVERADRRWWTAYSAVLVLVALGHFLALMILAAHGAFALGRHVSLRRMLVAWVPACGVALAVAAAGITQSSAIDWIARGGINRLYGTAYVLAGGPIAAVVLGLSVAAFALWVARDGHRVRSMSWLVVMLALPVTLWLVGHLTPLFVTRYVLWVVPFAALAAVIVWSRVGTTLVLLTALVVTVSWIPGQLDTRASDGHGTAYRDAVEYIAARAQQGDVVTSEYGRALDAVDRYSDGLKQGRCIESATGTTWELVTGRDLETARRCFPGRTIDASYIFGGVLVNQFGQ
ncbi:glycosyltransferase family 39 protein [Rhodococcus sp. BP-241]|uniref:glycosyltransferase family 39 protein n=1 Tax=Rhodococcus sp. BP-241 TaxID=2739441 RepID=UPI001C9A7037|nr:glycosyltransferase family 39 protein [Rhodococcus sp. BP-241]MBY6707818.1 glycosyltransferase family 39 protein [Rhodococcus sp. BP-241]